MNSYHDVISMHAYIALRVMDIERKKELKSRSVTRYGTQMLLSNC